MSPPPRIHLAILQPGGYVHSLGFLDQARYLRHQFRRLGAQVSLAKNRLREDAVNFVFGAHLGFPPDWQRRNPCIFVNLEQLGAGGAAVEPAYLDLLRRSAVVDYERANASVYSAHPAQVPLVPFGYASYLDEAGAAPAIALEDRPIDLLFFGSLNPRRRRFIERIEATGLSVSAFDGPLYGPERDAFVAQAKAVVNCHFYETARFEQARAFHALSLGTPVISERTAATQPPAAFEDSVLWLEDAQLETFFSQTFGTPAYFERARAALAAFRRPDTAHDPLPAYAELLDFARRFQAAHAEVRGTEPWRPRYVNLGSGKDYKPNWLNIDILDRAEPDLVLDLGRPLALPHAAPTRLGGTVSLEPGSLDLVYANNVLEHVPDLPMLMGNVLALLREGGEFHIEVPYERAPTAWQDPTHLRALNENSWIYYTDWFWYLGWFEHRFELAQFAWLDAAVKPCGKEAAAFMRATLRKVATTPRERTTARTMQADFGGLSDDLPVRPAAFAPTPAAPAPMPAPTPAPADRSALPA